MHYFCRFMDLCSVLEPGRPTKTDKPAILDDAMRVLNQLKNETQELKETNEKLLEEIKSLKVNFISFYAYRTFCLTTLRCNLSALGKSVCLFLTFRLLLLPFILSPLFPSLIVITCFSDNLVSFTVIQMHELKI